MRGGGEGTWTVHQSRWVDVGREGGWMRLMQVDESAGVQRALVDGRSARAGVRGDSEAVVGSTVRECTIDDC